MLLLNALFRRAGARASHQSGLLRADDRVLLSGRVDLEPMEIFFRDRHIRKDSLDRAFRYAGIAVNTRIWIDKQFIRQFVKSFDGANRCTIGVFTFDTRLGNNICHYGKKISSAVPKRKIKP